MGKLRLWGMEGLLLLTRRFLATSGDAMSSLDKHLLFSEPC